MRAQEFVEELVRTVPWLEATAIVLKEKDVGTSGVNWHATIGPVSRDPKDRFDAIIAKRQAERLCLDWEGVEFEDDTRAIVRWVSV